MKGKVLDVGCGTGALAGLVSAYCYVGFDVDEESLTIARKQYPKHTFLSSLPPVEQVFDTVIALAVIEHVPDPVIFLRELAKRLSSGSGSIIICTTPHPVVGWMHTMGAKIGLFSRHANEEHRELLDRERIVALANEYNLTLVIYRRFLLCANQLIIFKRKGDST